MNQKEINAAVDYIYTHGQKYAEAKAHRVYLEEFRKSQKAMLMKAAMASGAAKTSAAAEMEAYADPAYIEDLSSRGQDYSPLSGDQMRSRVEAFQKLPPEVIEIIGKMVQGGN